MGRVESLRGTLATSRSEYWFARLAVFVARNGTGCSLCPGKGKCFGTVAPHRACKEFLSVATIMQRGGRRVCHVRLGAMQASSESDAPQRQSQDVVLDSNRSSR